MRNLFIRLNQSKSVHLLLVLIFCSSLSHGQAITKNSTSNVTGAVCPNSSTSYSVSIPSNFGSCQILWTATNGSINGANNLKDVNVKWSDVSGAIGTLTVAFSGCASGNSNEGVTSSKSELILSVNGQTWGSYNNLVSLDYCTPTQVNLIVPQMFVLGTGGLGQPALQEAAYAWTLPAGWQTLSGSTGQVNTPVNSISIKPTKCSVAGTVKVEGVIIDRCGSAGLSSPASIILSAPSPGLTISPQTGYTGGSACNTTPITFYATTSPLSCITNYKWEFPISWKWRDPADNLLKSGPITTVLNSISLTPGGTSADSGPIKATANFSCGSSVVSASYTPPYNAPVLSSSANPICTTSNVTFLNQPVGSTATFTSSNPGGLSVNSTTGVAARLNNFNGVVTITATLTGGCNPKPETITVNVGAGINSVFLNNIQANRTTGTKYFLTCTLPVGIPNTPVPTFKWYVDNVLKETTNIPDGWDYSNGSGTCSSLHYVRVDAALGCNVTLTNTQPFSINCSGGGGTLAVYPNPASSQLSVEFIADEVVSSKAISAQTTETLVTSDNSLEFSVRMVNSSNQTVLTGSSQSGKVNLDTHNLPGGLYYLHINKSGEIITREVFIKK